MKLLWDVSVKELKVIGRNSFPLIYFSLNTEKNSFVLSDKVEKEFFPCLLSKNTSGNSILQKDFPCHIMTFPSIYSKMTKVNKK